MVPVSATRRKVLFGICQLAAVTALAPCARAAEQSVATTGNSDLDMLAGIAYDVLPYAELPPELYIKAARQILDSSDPDVVRGLEKLRQSIAKARWQDVTESDRVALLLSVQDTPFFHVLRANTLQVLLREPATFAIVGYGGPSIQYGGYLNRGFNDIHWLPAATKK